MDELVSIIMPSYNTANYIAASIQSVLDQTYPNWELLLVDDCSMDDTDAVVAPFLTSALDPQMVGEVLEVMRDLAHEGLTMIIVTHEMAFARDVSKRVIFMANGVIVEDRPPKELFENPKDPLTKDFLSRFRNA